MYFYRKSLVAGFQKWSCFKEASSLVAVAVACTWLRVAHRPWFPKQTIWRQSLSEKNPALSYPWLLVPAPRLCHYNKMTKVLLSAKRPFSHNGTAEGQWRVVWAERRKGTFSADFSITESVMSNLTHRQRGILTQDFYIIAECCNQRISNKRVPWILVLEKKSMTFFSFKKDKGLAPAFWLRIWILNPKQRETSKEGSF